MTKIEPEWKRTEKIVADLEKILSPTAKVEHNVYLPVIGSSRRRQCDVVITYGEEPRQHIAIVEVQKRNKKPDINTFHGWVKKMQRVGAQQLICVSALGFPKSIIEEVATQMGDKTVMLMTLEDLSEATAGVNIIMLPFTISTKPTFEIKNIGKIRFKNNFFEKISFQSDDNVFSIGEGNECIDINKLIANELNTRHQLNEIHLPETYDVVINFNETEHDLWLHYGGEKAKIADWSMTLKITENRVKYETNVEQFVYHQSPIGKIRTCISYFKIHDQDNEHNARLIVQFKQPTLLNQG